MDRNRKSWETRWESERPGFHQSDVNGSLKEHTEWLKGGGTDGVYVPLCGASVDLDWLSEHFDAVVGTELVTEAVDRYFRERELAPAVTERGNYRRHTSGSLTLLEGDALVLTPEDTGPISAWYDRAAMIALRPELRRAYVSNLQTVIPPGARGLLVTLIYDQSIASGPPWSVDEAEVRSVYEPWCEVERVFFEPEGRTPPKFGDAPVHKAVFRLMRRLGS